MVLKSGLTISGGSVTFCTSSAVRPGAPSFSTMPAGRDFDHGQVGHDEVHAPYPGEGKAAFLADLRRAVLGAVIHHDDHVLRPHGDVAGAAHALDHLAGDHPVG